MTKRTPQIESAILKGFAEGLSLGMACRAQDVSRSAFLQWKAADPDLARRHEAAQLLHAESLVDECLELADDLDRMEGGAAVARFTRQQIDTRLKVARFYFKRHDAAAERRATETARREAEPAAEPEPTEARTREKPARVVPERPASGPVARTVRLAVASETMEPERRYAGTPA